VQRGTHGVGEYPNRTFNDFSRLWAVSYRRVGLNSFLLADLPHLSHTQLARVVRHDFAYPFLVFILCGSFEYLEGFWCVRLKSNGRAYTARL